MTPELVPRGTRFVAMRFSPEMVRAIEMGFKLESRRIITRGNARVPRGDFDQLDLASGRPDGLFPISSLRCRVQTSGGRRSVTITPRIRPNACVWPRQGQSGELAQRKNARLFLRVKQVQARRLNDISELEARLEGIRVFAGDWNHHHDAPDSILQGAAYDALLDLMGKTRAARWRRGEIHRDIVGRGPSARDCFALLWEYINGPGSWAKNPWVWRYVFERIPADSQVSDTPGYMAAEEALNP